MTSAFWDERYGADEYAYGTEPNDFLRAEAHHIPPGRVLCLAEGEGRNAVHLAALGYEVTAVDQSAQGLAKAEKLAAARGVKLELVQADLGAFHFPRDTYAGVVCIFGHTPAPIRQRTHAALRATLVPGGVYVAELYRPEQLALGTGGPRDPSFLATLDELRAELDGLELRIARAVERVIHEGKFHAGNSATSQLLAVRPR